MVSSQVVRSQLEGVSGAVVVIDVLRAFTTAAYAFASGAESSIAVRESNPAMAFAGQAVVIGRGAVRVLR